jgi:SNF2 family DNA or RNA helicase
MDAQRMDIINKLPLKEEKGTLRPYQVKDLSHYIGHLKTANLSDPGTGKTPSVCVYQQFLWQYQGRKTVWAMPKSLLTKNRDEILQFTDFRPEQVIIVDGTPKQRAKQFTDPWGIVFLMGFSRFSDDWETLLTSHDDVTSFHIDEWHLGYSTNDSKRTKNMYIAARKMPIFLPMTGTLITGRLDAAYPAIKIIEPNYYPNHQVFMAQHGELNDFGQYCGWKNHNKLSEIFARHTIRRSFESIFSKQEIVYEFRPCQMDPKHDAAYREFEKEAILELEDSFLDGTLPGVHAIRCRQIMACPEVLGIATSNPRTGKDEQVLIDIEDHKRTGEPFIIFAVFESEIERITELCIKAGLRVGTIYGKEQTGRDIIDSQFRSGYLDVIVASAKTAGVGFNWGHVNHIAFASEDYQDDSFVQAVRRAIRGKRDKPLRVTIYEYLRTLEQRIMFIMDRKSREKHKVDPSYTILNLSPGNRQQEVKPDPQGLSAANF